MSNIVEQTIHPMLQQEIERMEAEYNVKIAEQEIEISELKDTVSELKERIEVTIFTIGHQSDYIDQAFYKTVTENGIEVKRKVVPTLDDFINHISGYKVPNYGRDAEILSSLAKALSKVSLPERIVEREIVKKVPTLPSGFEEDIETMRQIINKYR